MLASSQRRYSSLDKGKTTFRTITLVNKTPKTEDLMKLVDDEEGLKKLGYKVEKDEEDGICFIPYESATVIGETDEPSKVELRDKVYPPRLSGETDKPVTFENTNAAPVVVAEALTEHEHAWDDGVVTKAATCTEVGLKTYTCESGETMTNEITMISHVCDENGVCTACGIAIEEPKDEQQEEPKADTPAVLPAAEPVAPVVVETPVGPAPTAEPPKPVTESTPTPVELATETEPAK